MDIAIASAIVNCNDGELELMEAYSGRSMFGKVTAGVVGPKEQFTIGCMGLAFELGKENDEEMFMDLQDAIKDIRTDNMGRSDLIFY